MISVPPSLRIPRFRLTHDRPIQTLISNLLNLLLDRHSFGKTRRKTHASLLVCGITETPEVYGSPYRIAMAVSIFGDVRWVLFTLVESRRLRDVNVCHPRIFSCLQQARRLCLAMK